MNNDRVEGALKNTGGKIKEGFGKLVGDASLETEGKADQVEGKVQNAIGGIKDALNKKD
ncbi:MAG: CsbD family protein [Polymorphobacter sp.]